MECIIIASLFRTMQSLLDAEKEPQDYGTGQPLYKAELRLLEAVHRSPGANASSLARQLGVTRGALTQMGDRLAEKGLIERFSQPDNKKEKYLRLTDTGNAAWQARQTFHATANRDICTFLRSLSADEKQVILQFLDKVESAMPITRFDCHHPESETPCL